MVDHWLHSEGVAGSQMCAAMRGFDLSYRAIENFVRRDGAARVVGMRDVQQDDALRGDVELLLAEHLASHGVHRVCEELLIRTKVCLPFAALRSHLLAEPRLMGRLQVEDCWRVLFAWLERSAFTLADDRVALDAVRPCLSPAVDVVAAANDPTTAAAFEAYTQAWSSVCKKFFSQRFHVLKKFVSPSSQNFPQTGRDLRQGLVELAGKRQVVKKEAAEEVAPSEEFAEVEPSPVVSEDGKKLEALDVTASELGPASRSLAASSHAAGAAPRSKRIRVS